MEGSKLCRRVPVKGQCLGLNCLNLWVLNSSWTSPLSKAPSGLVDLGPFYCVWDLLCDRERPPALCWGHPGCGSCVCAHVHPCSSCEHWELRGVYLLGFLSMRRGSSPGGATARLWVWGAPAQTKHRAVCDNRKRTATSSARLSHLPVHRLGKMLLVWGSWCPDEALCTP